MSTPHQRSTPDPSSAPLAPPTAPTSGRGIRQQLGATSAPPPPAAQAPYPAPDQATASAAQPRTQRTGRHAAIEDDESPQVPAAARPTADTRLDAATPAVSVSSEVADSQFREAGREDFHRPTAPHLDARLTGLDDAAKRSRSIFGRRKRAAGFDNEPSNGFTIPITTPRRISVVGMKGGVGKTTMSLLTSTAIARTLRLPVLLLDSDTTYGSLMLRTGMPPIASAEDLAAMGDPGDLRVLSSAVSRTRDGVWAVPSGRTPAQSAAFGEKSYVAAVRAVYRHFPVMLTDCGAGLAGPLMHRVISASHSLVIATAPSMDSLLASYNTLEWLNSIGYEDLARRSIIGLSNVDPEEPRIDLEETRRRFGALCGGVVVIPRDAHLAPGSVLEYDSLAVETRQAAETLAATALAAAHAAG